MFNFVGLSKIQVVLKKVDQFCAKDFYKFGHTALQLKSTMNWNWTRKNTLAYYASEHGKHPSLSRLLINDDIKKLCYIDQSSMISNFLSSSL